MQIIASVISADETYDADVMAITAASCALCLSDIPFAEPVAAVRVGMIDGALKVFPTLAEIETAKLDLIVAGSETSIVMVEGNAGEVSEDVIVDAISLAHGEIKKLVAMQKDLMAKTGAVRPAFTPSVLDERNTRGGK